MNNTMTWQVAAASVLGRHHRLLGKNRQDAFCHRALGEAVAIAVTDGCGSAPHSEVGAYLGAQAAVAAMWRMQPDTPHFVARVIEAVLATVVSELRDDAFLFTLCGAYATARGACAFVFGDGAVMIDGHVHRFESEAPDYPAYHSAPLPVFEQYVAHCHQLAVATDGCAPLVGDDRHFTHADALRRTLVRGEPDDDATLVIARRCI